MEQTDKLDKIYRICELLNQRFGEETAFETMTRLAEEVGELAAEVNHFEGKGVKAKKHGAPSKEKLVLEAQDVIRAVLHLVQKYDAKEEFAALLDSELENWELKKTKWAQE